MATFFNQATLSYNDVVTNSNIVTGEIVEVLSGSKTAVSENYTPGDPVTYVINLVNTGSIPFTGLTVTDDLGTYDAGTTPPATVTPLDYVAGTVRYFVNGELQAQPTVTDTNPLTITGINVPANGNVTIIYEARANEFAPPAADGTINNTATVTGGGLTAPLVLTESLSAAVGANLTITKSLTPETVTENGELTYTLTISNTGNEAIVDTDNAVVTDTFNPILNPITVTYNGTTWTEAINYTYDETTGLFSTVIGQITVPAATYTRNPETGAWTVTPGVSVIRIRGTV